MKKTIHAVPHSHWDREWYFTTSRSKVYLMRDVQDVLDVLEKDDRFSHFVLDGQASLLDDYLAWRPQDEPRIRHLVQSGKLIIGPWYTQTDQLVISAESIVRNLYYGIRRCQQLGPVMMIGYMPDSFGQAANMPQIYRQFGIEDTVFWRGVAIDMTGKTEFIWRGSDGSEVQAFQMPLGYFIGGFLPSSAPGMHAFLKDPSIKMMLDTLLATSSPHVLFPSGFDQSPIRKALPDVLVELNKVNEDWNFHISSFQKYIDAVKANTDAWMTLEGELVNPKFMRIHKSIFSSRADLKSLNTWTQNYLVNVLEPLLTLADHLGHDYPHPIMEHLWKLMFENAAHDSIGSCVSDTTNQDIAVRYKQVKDIAQNLAELTQREIARRIEGKADQNTLTVFNLLPYPRSGVFECEAYIPGEPFALVDSQGNTVPCTVLSQEDMSSYIKAQMYPYHPEKKVAVPAQISKALLLIELEDVEAMGYRQLTLVPDAGIQERSLEVSNVLENEFYRITINANGSLTIEDKRNQHTYANQMIFEESGDDGDSFNYSVPHHDWVITSQHTQATVAISQSEHYHRAEIDCVLTIPKDLSERAEKKASLALPIHCLVEVYRGDPIIALTVTIANQGDSHRLRVLFDTAIASSFSFADQQFGLIKRPVYREQEMALFKQSAIAWQETPLAIETCQSYVALADDRRGLALIPQGVREYEIIHDDCDTLALTLYRTYGFMGKANLIHRPGRASGDSVVATPNAQLHKTMVFKLGAYYWTGDFNSAQVSVKAKEFNTPVLIYQEADFLNSRLRFVLEDVERTLPSTYSWFAFKDAKLSVSAIKKAEDRPGTIVRIFNGLDRQSAGETLQTRQLINKAERLNLLEETEAILAADDHQLEIRPLDHCEFITLYFETE